MQQQYPIPLTSLKSIYKIGNKSNIHYWFIAFGVVTFLFLMLPWTQNIRTNGLVTSIYPEQRPQGINSPIPGKIERWFVKEGDVVKKGDTLLQLAEIKVEYLDPNLVKRNEEQLQAKKGTNDSYRNKVSAYDQQNTVLKSALELKKQQLINKIKQTENKLLGEKGEQKAIENDLVQAKDQYERQEKMFEEGLVSQTQLQQRNVSYQNALAKKISIENKIQQTQQELINIKIEISSNEQEYIEKMVKVQTDQFTTLGQIESGNGEIAKLENQIINYKIRNGLYFILAPQDGQVIQVKNAGLGEIIKEEENILQIVPTNISYAVEMFVRPVDLPLIDTGQTVRLIFDGFPAIVFSGWPQNSYGTFGGQIVTYENTINEEGLFRVLVSQPTNLKHWPPQLKVGSGVKTITLLNDVPIWYELWRNINGFPPDFYKINSNKNKGK